MRKTCGDTQDGSLPVGRVVARSEDIWRVYHRKATASHLLETLDEESIWLLARSLLDRGVLVPTPLFGLDGPAVGVRIAPSVAKQGDVSIYVDGLLGQARCVPETLAVAQLDEVNITSAKPSDCHTPRISRPVKAAGTPTKQRQAASIENVRMQQIRKKIPVCNRQNIAPDDAATNSAHDEFQPWRIEATSEIDDLQLERELANDADVALALSASTAPADADGSGWAHLRYQ